MEPQKITQNNNAKLHSSGSQPKNPYWGIEYCSDFGKPNLEPVLVESVYVEESWARKRTPSTAEMTQYHKY